MRTFTDALRPKGAQPLTGEEGARQKGIADYQAGMKELLLRRD